MAHAQTLDATVARLKPGTLIYVTDAGGETVRGAFEGLVGGSLRVRVDRDVEIPAHRITLVRKRGSSPLFGALIGGAVGALICVKLCGLSDSGISAPPFVTIGLYGALGAGLSQYVGTTTVYRAGGRTSATVTPIAGAGRISLGWVVRF